MGINLVGTFYVIVHKLLQMWWKKYILENKNPEVEKKES